MADADDCNSPKTLLQQNLDSRPEFHESTEFNSDRIRSMLNSESESTEEFDTGDPRRNLLLTLERSKRRALRKINTLPCTKDQIQRSMMNNQSSSTSSTSSKLPVKMKRPQPTTTNCSKKIKAVHVWKRSTFAFRISENGTASSVQISATDMPFIPLQDLQGMDEQVVHPEGSSADRSGYPEYTTLWIPD